MTKIMIKKPKKPKPVSVNIRMSEHEYLSMLKLADKFANGNLSLWIRHAATHYVLTKKDAGK